MAEQEAKKRKLANNGTTTAPESRHFTPPEGKQKLIIFDTSLRDGEQSPGVTLNGEEKVNIARALSRLGVDVCEAGFPVASDGDFEAVRRIAEEVGPLTAGRVDGTPMTIAALARATEKDIQRAFEAVKAAPRRRIHTFLATSDIHLKHKLRISREQCIETAVKAVKLAASLVSDVEFSPEDAGRSDQDFLCQVLGAVIEAGATTLNIPDTVGYNTPEQYGSKLAYLIANTPGGNKVTWSTHCHNDLGLATANTLAGVVAGARQVEVTINGIGERAGNTALEEVVMAIHVHQAIFPVYTSIDTTQIYRTSQLVTTLSGMVIQPNKAIVGANAFAHESGIHQDGMLKNKETYEIIRPETVGLGASSLVLGKHSGRHAFKARLNEIGYGDLSEEEITSAFVRFKKLADSKKTISDLDLHALLKDEVTQAVETYKLKTVQVTAGSHMIGTATVALDKLDGTTSVDAATGNGPIDAVFRAIDRLVGMTHYLTEYDVKAVTGGSDALGEVTVRITSPTDVVGNSVTVSGHGTDSDIVMASAKAYVVAVNRMVNYQERNGDARPVNRSAEI